MNVVKNLVDSSKYSIKCPHSMTAEYYAVHNTANDASARNEIAYMRSNNNKVSFHYAVDDVEVVQGIREDRNAWHAGDGGEGEGNRKAIGVEICYSKSGGERFAKAEKNAAKFIASGLKEKGWGIDKVKKHQDFSGKYCPHRTLDLGWNRFLKMVQAELDALNSGGSGAPETAEKNEKADTLYRVQAGAYTKLRNAEDLKKRLEKAGFDAYIVTLEGLYKVQVGAYSKKANADAMYNKLYKAGFDAFITTRGGKAVAAEPAPVKKMEEGSLVRVKKGAKDYSGGTLADFVYERNHTVKQINGNRVVITFNGVVVAAVHKDNLILL